MGVHVGYGRAWVRDEGGGVDEGAQDAGGLGGCVERRVEKTKGGRVGGFIIIALHRVTWTSTMILVPGLELYKL